MIAKRILSAAVLVAGGLMLGLIAAYLLVSDETLVGWIARRTEAATGVLIRYQTPARLSRTLSPDLTVADLVVADPHSGYRLSTSSFELQLSLPGLLLGRLDVPRLWLGDTHIEARGATSPAPANPIAGSPVSLPLAPTFGDIRIARLSIVHPDGEMRLPALDIDKLSLNLEHDTNTLVVDGRLQLADEPIDMAVQVPNLQDGLESRKIDYSIAAQSPVANLRATGYVDFGKPEFVLEGSLSAQATDLRKIPTGIKGLKAPGSLAAQARFAGTAERLAASDILVQWLGPEQSSLKVQGDIDDLDSLSGIALDVSGQLTDAAWLTPLLPDSVAALKQAEVKAQLRGDAGQLNVGDISLSATDTNLLQVSLSGQFDLALGADSLAANNMALGLKFEAPTTHAARALLFEQVPEFGAIHGTADIRSETGDPSLENIVVTTRDRKGIEVDLKGRIAGFPLDPARPNRGYDLDVGMKAQQVALMGERLGLTLPVAGPADASYRIEGDTEALRLEQIELTAGEKKAVRLSATGQIHFGEWDQADPLQMVNLNLQASSSNTRSLAKLLGTELPELGGLNAKARLQTVSNRHQITDFQVQTKQGSPVSVSLSGVADRVLLLPEPAVEDIALDATATTADVASLNKLFGWQAVIPAIGPAEARASISGDDRALAVSQVSITAGSPDLLLVKASGSLGTLSASSDWHPRDMALKIKAAAPGTRAVAKKAFDYQVPELGPLAASAIIRSKSKTLALESGRIRVGDAWTPAIQGEGYVNDLLGAARTRWDATLELNGHQLAEFADNKQLPDLGPLTGKLQISNTDGSLGIDQLSLSSSGSDLLSLAINGRYGDFHKLETLSLNGRVKARDLEIVGALLDRDWPAIGPVIIETRATRKVNNLAIDTTITADKAEVNADLVATLEARPLLISGTIVARNAFVPSVVQWHRRNITEKSRSAGPVFSREPIAFDWMHKVDLDLTLDVESMDAELGRAESAHANIAMSSGQLWIRPATINYPTGKLGLDVQLDARSVPSIHVKAFGDHLDPWRTLYLEQGQGDLKGRLDVDIDLALSGRSAHELAAGANGDIYLQLQNGAIRSDLIDLLFVDVVGWAESKALRKKYDRFSCGVADYSIAQGVVNTRAFILDSTHITISGEGTIDLGKEQVDYVFLPRKKSALITSAEPVKLTGPLDDPKVSALPWKSAAATYGTLWFAPYVFVGIKAVDYLAGEFRGKREKSPCLEYQKKFSRPDRESSAEGNTAGTAAPKSN